MFWKAAAWEPFDTPETGATIARLNVRLRLTADPAAISHASIWLYQE
jgi:hypothetical protein